MSTKSMGKRNKMTHKMCRRCGKRAYHITKHACSACGFGRGAKQRAYSWQQKTLHGGRRI